MQTETNPTGITTDVPTAPAGFDELPDDDLFDDEEEEEEGEDEATPIPKIERDAKLEEQVDEQRLDGAGIMSDAMVAVRSPGRVLEAVQRALARQRTAFILSAASILTRRISDIAEQGQQRILT